MTLSIRRAKARAAQLRKALEVCEASDVPDAERAFNFKRHWDALIAQAPRSKRSHFEMLGAQIAEESPTFKRLVWPEP